MTWTCLKCGDPSDDIVHHVRLFHPDVYDPGMEAWPVEEAA